MRNIKVGYKQKKEFKVICNKCGHNHVAITSDNGINNDEERYELLSECCYCDCENYDFRSVENESYNL